MKKELVTSKAEVTTDVNKTPTLSSTEIAAIWYTLLVCQLGQLQWFSEGFMKMVDTLHCNYEGHCPLSEVYLIYGSTTKPYMLGMLNTHQFPT